VKRSNIDAMICKQEGITEITRDEIHRIQLEKLNIVLKREKEREGFYRDLPERLESLIDLRSLPFTTETDLARDGGRMLLCSQGEVQKVISEQTSGTTGAGKRVFYTEGDCEHTIELFMAGLGEFIYPGSNDGGYAIFRSFWIRRTDRGGNQTSGSKTSFNRDRKNLWRTEQDSGRGATGYVCGNADGIAVHASNVRKRQYKKSTGIRRCLSENCHESNRRNSANTTLAALWFQRDGAWRCHLLHGA